MGGAKQKYLLLAPESAPTFSGNNWVLFYFTFPWDVFPPTLLSILLVFFWFALQMMINFTSPVLHPTRNALDFNKYSSVNSCSNNSILCQIYLSKRRHYCSAPSIDNWPRNCAALVSWVLPYTTWYMPLREGVKKNNRFFLGLCPKLWVGGGQKS